MRRLVPALAAILITATWSSAGAAPGRPTITDVKGDALVTTIVPGGAVTAPPETNVPGYDIVSAHVDSPKRGKKKSDPVSLAMSLTLAAPPEQVGFYTINFDVPDCTGGPTWVGAPVQPPTGQVHHEAGMRVILVTQGPVPEVFVDCISPAVNDPWTRYAAFASIAGNTITWDVPANPYLKSGVTLTNIRAYTGTKGVGYQEFFMDLTGPGGPVTVK